MPPVDPKPDAVELPALQETDEAAADQAKIDELTSWSGAPVEPPAEYNPTAVAPPAQDAGSVSLDQAGDQLLQVEDLPVKLGQATPTAEEPTPPAPSGSWAVSVEAREATESAGVDGAIIKVTPPSTGATPVDVELDYGTFEDLYGTEWASRLELTQLPECFLTTPELEECATPVEVPSTNDPATGTVRATIDPAAGQVQGLSTQAGGGSVVLAATDSASGAGGTYKATSLSPSGSWTAGGSGGGFSWSYPLTVPAPPAGPAPKIAFSYSSQSVDGKTSVANSQASWIGDGWDYHPGFVERRYRSCSEDRKNSPNNDNATDKKKSDLCWASDNLVLSLGGSTTELVRDDATGKWVPANDDGAKVEYLAKDDTAKAKQTGGYDGEYWRVTTRDGTRYYFGRNDVDGSGTRAVTNSAFTVPVFGNHTGEPCHQATYAASFCTQAWRWNLDYVEDVHGNAMIIDWKKDTNRYAKNGKFKQAVDYVRDGYPTQILYGLRAGNLDGAPAGKVEFAVDERCIREGTTSCSLAEFESKNYEEKQPWWDTPSTLHCKVGVPDCYVTAPTFWSRIMLRSVKTYGQRTPGSTALSLVDTWNLKQSFPKQRTDTHPPLWLESITRTGYGTTKDENGNQTSTPLPAVSFVPNVIDMPNRVATSTTDATPDFDRLRVETIRTETGGDIYVEYSDPCPVGTTHPTPEANTSRCFPVHWSPDPDLEKPPLEWFNKYVVDRVVEKDRATRQPDVVTTYTYEGGGAWAKATDEFSKPELRTYNQWRGYASVTVTRGETANTGGTDATVQSKTQTRYFRGMSGDAGRATVMIKDSTGTETLGEDLPAYQGRVAETITYTMAGTGGTVHARQLSWPYVKTMATRVRGDGLPDLKAYRTSTVRSDAIETVSTGKRTARTETTYEDTYGLPTSTYSYTLGTDGTTRANESCTKPMYVHNTIKNLIGLPQRVRTTVGPCTVAPLVTGDGIISDSRTSYDALNAFGTAPTKGLPFQTDTVSGDGTGWITSARTEYDALGRALKVTDAKGNATTTAYSPTTGPAFQVTTTNAKTHTGISTLDPARGSVLSATDPNNRKVTSTYDDLGRVTAVWSPSRQGSSKASVYFDYQISNSKVPAVTTRTLRDNGTYEDSVVLYDGLLRPRQTQTEALGGGRIVTDTHYNSSGTVRETWNGYLAENEPTAEVFVPLSLSDIHNSTKTAYDGLGRAVRSTTLYEGNPQHSSTVQYGGDWTLARTAISVEDGTTPLSGSRAVRTETDALGRTVKVQHYTNVTGPAATIDTQYTYDPRGKLAKVTDHAGNNWTYTYDVRGRLIASSDPDMGAASFGYNELDQQIWSEDTLGRTQHTLYDELGRTTELHDDSATGPLVAKWTYDTLPGALGYPVASTRYNDGAPYTSEVTGYDTEYRPTGTKITIPGGTATAGLAGTYAYANTYTETGKPQSVTLPATPGGLAAEKIITRYSGEGAPLTTSGLAWYTGGTTYSPFGEVLRTVSGEAPRRIWTTNDYDANTGRLTGTTSDREATIPNSRISTLTYGYDTVGNVTSIKDEQSTAAIDQQCFAYDPMGRLVHAWTGTTGCPRASGAQGDGPNATQVSPGINGGGYWQSYEFDAIGNRTKLTVHDPTGVKPAEEYAYTYGRTETNNGTQPPTTAQPHTLTDIKSKQVIEGSTFTLRQSYGYDASGNTTERITAGGDTQVLEWDRRNKLTKAIGFANGKGALVSPSGKCLDVQSGSTADGTPIQLYTCNGTAAQQWRLVDGALKALGKCATASGMNLVLSTCNGGEAQKFTHRPGDASLFNQAASACVDVPNADYTDGKDLQLSACNQSDQQKWNPGDTTSYLYDAGGNRLIETTATTRTLFLPDAQITATTSGTPLRAERYYTHPGAPTTVRTTQGGTTGHKLTVLLSDHHNTATVAVDQSEGQPLTRRAFDPYGNPRGTEPTKWPGRQTFLGTGTDDPTTGLTHIGAREYDSTTGRFISADPLIDITDPLQMNGYTYANGSPVTLSDPDGLRPIGDCERGCSSSNGNTTTYKQDYFYLGGNGEYIYNSTKTAVTTNNKFRTTVTVKGTYNPRKGRTDHATVRQEVKSTGSRKEGTVGGWNPVKVYDSEGMHLALDAVGLVPGAGGPADVANAILYMSEGNWTEAGWSLVGIIPIVGEFATVTRKGDKLLDVGSASRKGPGTCPVNSFVAGTKVLMADGSIKPIEDLQVGDEVIATDPETGETTAKTVTATILTEDDKSYVDLTVSTEDGAEIIATTDHHPFWSESDQAWLDAGELKPGMTLRTDTGATVTVAAARSYAARQDTYNLTVADLHTYYVLAGQTPVLVHNSNCPTASKYEDITSPGARMLNKSTDVGPVEFGKNLEANGWARTDKGPNIMYEKDGARYFLRGKANSHEGWTADYYNPGSKKADIKIRLGED
ncbi:polymorphic toxin-type HINT domain-containing protein [Streptomyces vilmorinianum]|uniref:polymorphic toxin-type HINT domain-containing protein n=1 Tax=Streptomyces vilmorinianum TaxID=3051092 RepID=UPI0020C75946|nr:polymorphic toxin-type HINT domain-containing protein [Streptomyces vilmorinianum]